MSQIKQDRVPNTEIADSAWQGLCKIGGVATLLQLACVLVTMVVLLTTGGEPGTAAEYFSVLENNRLIGLIRMDFPSILTVALYSLTLFGLYAALRRNHGAYMALATALGFAGIILWLGTHSAFSMISLSDQYAAATSDIQRSQFLAAGQAVIASDMWHSTGAVMGGIFLQSATTIISVLMLRSKIFSKATAYVGILTHGLDLAHILIIIFAPGIGVYLMIAAGPLYPVWFILVARRLFQLAAERARTPLPIEAG